jgi:hypothetical protein
LAAAPGLARTGILGAEATMEAQDDDFERDELDESIREFETRHPEIRSEMARMRVVLRMTTALWQRREELSLSVEQVAERSGLTIEEVEAVEDNDVDSPFQRLARYAEAVGLQFELQQIPA